MMKIRWYFLVFVLAFNVFLSSCHMSIQQADAARMTSINILDHNGISQTICTKNRLVEYEKTDFLAPQPYQKVMRVYAKEKNGDVKAQITSYHPNGQIKQYLEAVNNRAFGNYYEWFANGTLKVQARIIGGVADLNSQAEESWLFDGVSCAWDDEGHFLAEISYSKGELEGQAYYYHVNGKLWKSSPYHKGKLHGVEMNYTEDGTLLQSITYCLGQKEGKAYRYWSPAQLAYEEYYQEGLLFEGHYFSKEGLLLSEVCSGNGKRALFGKNAINEMHEYQQGEQEGLVEIFDDMHHLICCYRIHKGEKQGEEIAYYPHSKTPKLLLTWHQGMLQGPVKTWYENGSLESQREMSQNQKNGLLMAWYPGGNVMLVEEYENELLLKGEYYRLAEPTPISKIEGGKGIAFLYTPEGIFTKKIHYNEGRPLE